MLWLPLQSFAANLAGADCAQDVAEAYTHGHEVSVSHDADHGPSNPDNNRDGNVSTTVAHDCCHHQASIASLFLPANIAPPHVLPAVPLIGGLSYFPEPFQRPPRSAAA